MKEILIKGNSKMGKEVYLFNIPPKETCTPTDWCLHGRKGKPACYGLRNNYLMSNAIDSAKERLNFSKTGEFVPSMIDAIHSKKAKYFRLHSTGDFYNEEYVKKIIEIAKECPETKFRTTTRRRDLTGIIQELNSLPNFIVRESLDKDRVNPEMGLPYAAIASILSEEVKTEVKNNLSNSLYKCINDCTACQHYCWNSRTNVYFEEH
jgi:hypothetical protein